MQQQQRDIPSLLTLCVRSITPKACLPLTSPSSSSSSTKNNKKQQQETIKPLLQSLSKRPSKSYTIPKCIGSNHVDVTSPWIAVVSNNKKKDGNNKKKQQDQELTIERSNGALDFLQLLLDTFIEIGQCDNNQLFTIDLFNHWKSCIINTPATNSNKKRKHSTTISKTNNNLASISFCNASSSSTWLDTMLESNLGMYLGVLDLTSVLSLTDELVGNIVYQCENLERLCLKNCRRITGSSMKSIEMGLPNLKSIDVGGCVNINPEEMISLVTNHNTNNPNNKKTIAEMHVSGLNWNDKTLSHLIRPIQKHSSLKGLSIGFSQFITAEGIIQTMPSSIETLVVPFCECVTDDTLEELGRICTNLKVLDIRGCGLVTTLTPLLECLSSSTSSTTGLFVLARYTSITALSIQESKNLYPNILLDCVIDGTGQGKGIIRSMEV